MRESNTRGLFAREPFKPQQQNGLKTELTLEKSPIISQSKQDHCVSNSQNFANGGTFCSAKKATRQGNHQRNFSRNARITDSCSRKRSGSIIAAQLCQPVLGPQKNRKPKQNNQLLEDIKLEMAELDNQLSKTNTLDFAELQSELSQAKREIEADDHREQQ